MNNKEILERTKKDKVKFVLLQFTDIFGVVKSLTIHIDHLADSLKYGTWFDGSSIEGFARIHESDMMLRPDISTYTVVPWLGTENEKTVRFICDIYKPDGKPFAGDPRYILKRAIADAEKMGFEYNVGPEMEFFLFKKENGELKPLPHDNASYFDLSMDQAYKIRENMIRTLEKFHINVEASHHEVARGQHEIDFKYDKALKTADNASTLRFVLKAIAQEYDLHATFMPKPIMGINGSGMHIHQSFFDEKNKNVFFDKNDENKLSKMAYSFIAGQLEHIKAMSAILSPTVNSYKRLVPGYEAPIYISWAASNRTALIRVPRYSVGKEQSTRVELRSPDPTCNLYLAFAVMLKTGLNGIKKNLTPPKSVEGDIYNFDRTKLRKLKIDTLPDSLWEAIKELKKDKVVQDALGNHIWQNYVEAKTK
ncbi:MAG: glutamine synthetase, partial [Candidatus Cloacimonetes bacterium]|nr:glutamine synthetase [Candidatus Cloacimonadota bacterium]